MSFGLWIKSWGAIKRFEKIEVYLKAKFFPERTDDAKTLKIS